MQYGKKRKPNRRTETIAFRVSREQRDRLEEGAIEAGMTLSGYLSALLDKRITHLRARLAEMHEPAPAPQQMALPPDVARELSRIGNNINQMAHAINSGLPPEPRDMVRKLKTVLDIIHDNRIAPASNPRQRKSPIRSANDGSPPPQTRQEFQRSVQLHPTRPWRFND